LPSVGWRTGQSGAPLDSHCRRSDANLFPFLAQMTIAALSQLAHWTLSGAHRTVRCPCRLLAWAMHRPWIARPTVALAVVGSPDSPVNYSRTPPIFPESGLFTGGWPGASDTVRCTTRHCPVHHRTVRCAKPSWTSAVHSQVTCNPFLLFFSLFLALRQNMLVLKTMY
jgi:hypothetical protein